MKVAALFVLLLVSTAGAQPADTLWTRAFGSASDEGAYGLCQISNGDIIVVGKIQASASVPFDALVMRVSSSGELLHQSILGGTGNDAFYGAAPTTDGGFVVTGFTQPGGIGQSDVYLVKFSAAGDSVWSRTFGGAFNDFGYTVVQMADGGFAVAGTTQISAQNSLMYLIRTDAAGATLWTHSYTLAASAWAMAMCPARDGGFLLAGYSLDGNYRGSVIRTNSAGDSLWTRSYTSGYSIQLSAVAQTSDGGFILGGWTQSTGAFDDYLLKIDASGTQQWSRTTGGTGVDQARSVIQDSDGGYMLAGYSNSYGAGNYDAYFIKYNSDGNVLWTRPVGGSGDDKLMVAIAAGDGGYIGAGTTQSFGQGRPGSGDVYVMRLAAPIGIGGVIRSHAQPQANVFVSELNGTYFARSDAQGRYFLSMQPGPHDLITFGPCSARDTLRNVTVIEDTVTVVNWSVNEPEGLVAQTSINLVVHNHVADTGWVQIENQQDGALDYFLTLTTVTPHSNWLSLPAAAGTVPPFGMSRVPVRILADTTDTGYWDYYGYVTVHMNSCPDSMHQVYIMASVLDADHQSSAAVHEYRLSAYPNPFNPQTTIRFSVAQTEHAALTVYDVSGRKVRDLVTDVVTSGDHQAVFDAANLPSGLYFVRLHTASRNIIQKIMLLR